VIATIMDFKPQVNIAPFGMCSSMADPRLRRDSICRTGVLTSAVYPGAGCAVVAGAATMNLGGIPVLTDPSTCQCTWAGQISIVTPGQQTIRWE
jgi:hypothetical protein